MHGLPRTKKKRREKARIMVMVRGVWSMSARGTRAGRPSPPARHPRWCLRSCAPCARPPRGRFGRPPARPPAGAGAGRPATPPRPNRSCARSQHCSRPVSAAARSAREGVLGGGLGFCTRPPRARRPRQRAGLVLNRARLARRPRDHGHPSTRSFACGRRVPPPLPLTHSTLAAEKSATAQHRSALAVGRPPPDGGCRACHYVAGRRHAGGAACRGVSPRQAATP